MFGGVGSGEVDERADAGVASLAVTDAGRALLADAWPLVTASDDWFAGGSADTEALVATLRPLSRGGAVSVGPAPRLLQ